MYDSGSKLGFRNDDCLNHSGWESTGSPNRSVVVRCGGVGGSGDWECRSGIEELNAVCEEGNLSSLIDN